MSLFQPEKFQHKIVTTVLTKGKVCNICSEIIYLYGYRCQLCEIVFHGRCQSNIPNGQICTPPLEINASKIKKHFRIGVGSFGYVYKGAFYDTNVAIKTIKSIRKDESTQALINEFEILKKISHVNILSLKGICILPKPKVSLCIIMQWCDNFSLYKHLHVNEPSTKFSSFDIIKITKQIAKGMTYLHSNDIFHRDLKSNNIFLTCNMLVKIGDFGMATTKSAYREIQEANHLPGTASWIAPEVIRTNNQNKTPFTFAADVYSFGIICYELASGRLPYITQEEHQILYMVARGLLKLDFEQIPPVVSCSFKELIRKCTEYDRNLRPDFKMILIAIKNMR